MATAEKEQIPANVNLIKEIIYKSDVSPTDKASLTNFLDNNIKVKKTNPRNTFMSGCMRGEDKGGEGKSMKACSLTWKEEKDKK